jgi:hypothetical protein
MPSAQNDAQSPKPPTHLHLPVTTTRLLNMLLVTISDSDLHNDKRDKRVELAIGSHCQVTRAANCDNWRGEPVNIIPTSLQDRVERLH